MQALDLLGTTDDPRTLGSLYIDIGNAFSELGGDVRDIAIRFYERAVELLLPTGDWAELARAYVNLGVDVGESHPQDGIDLLEKAEQASERAHDTRNAARSLVAIAELHLALGQVEQAERDNEHVGHLLEHMTDGLGRAWVESNRGAIAERRGLWEEAEHAFETALEMCRRFQLPGDEAEAAFCLARVRFKTRDLEGARRAYAITTDLGLLVLRPHLAAPYLELGQQLGVPPPAALPEGVSTASGTTEPGVGRGL
jgi:tetratricopeptide (TPR) repeat protein